MSTTVINQTTYYVWNPASMGHMAAIVSGIVVIGLLIAYWTMRESINKGLSVMLNGIFRPKIDGKGIIHRLVRNWPLAAALVAVIVVLGVFGR